MSSCKIWMSSDIRQITDEKYYGLYLIQNNICENIVLQQNRQGSIYIEGSCNKLSFHDDMTGDYREELGPYSNVAILTFGPEANYNMIEGVVNQGEGGEYWDYLCYFPQENSTQVGNQINITVWNWYTTKNMKIKNDVILHPSNLIKVNNRDFSKQWGNLITDSTALNINYSWHRNVATVLPNEKYEYYYDCPVNIANVSHREDGCFFSYAISNSNNIKSIFISFDVIGSNIEDYYNHRLVWQAVAINSNGSIKLYSDSDHQFIQNNWFFNGIINNTNNATLTNIWFGLFPHPRTTLPFPTPDQTYPDHTEIRIANIKLKILYNDGSEDIIGSI